MSSIKLPGGICVTTPVSAYDPFENAKSSWWGLNRNIAHRMFVQKSSFNINTSTNVAEQMFI